MRRGQLGRAQVGSFGVAGVAGVDCLDGGTPITRADGSTTPVAGLQVGDAVVGTVPGVRGRHYVITHVSARWETVGRPYLLRLADGRELVAGGGQRFLTEDGWACVEVGATARHSGAGHSGAGHSGGEESGDGRPDYLGGAPRPLRVGSVLVDATLPVGIAPLELVGRRLPDRPGVDLVAIGVWAGTRTMVDISTGTADCLAAGVVGQHCRPSPESRGRTAQ